MNWTRHDTRALIEAAAEKPRMSRGAVKVIRRHYAERGLVERMARFEDFCQRTNDLAHIWGGADCTLLLADWAVESGHADPAAAWRGTYDDEASCRAMLQQRGWLIGHVAACAQAAGLPLLHEPEFGAIAVIGSQSSPGRQWGAIWNGARWLVKWGNEQTAPWTPMAAPSLGIWRV